MNLRYLVLPTLLLFLGSGCTHFATPPSGSTETSNQSQETSASPYSNGTPDKIFHNGQLIERADLPGSDISAAEGRQTDLTAASDEGRESNSDSLSFKAGRGISLLPGIRAFSYSVG